MMFSKSCEYALKAVVYIAQQSKFKQLATLQNISEEIGSPTAFTSKVLQKLVKADLIQSVRGKEGGYKMSKSQVLDNTALDIVVAIDGTQITEGCVLGFGKCSTKKSCLFHPQFTVVRNNIKNNLRATTIDDLLFEYLEKRVVLKR